jgi:hypothetical protein
MADATESYAHSVRQPGQARQRTREGATEPAPQEGAQGADAHGVGEVLGEEAGRAEGQGASREVGWSEGGAQAPQEEDADRARCVLGEEAAGWWQEASPQGAQESGYPAQGAPQERTRSHGKAS